MYFKLLAMGSKLAAPRSSITPWLHIANSASRATFSVLQAVRNGYIKGSTQAYLLHKFLAAILNFSATSVVDATDPLPPNATSSFTHWLTVRRRISYWVPLSGCLNVESEKVVLLAHRIIYYALLRHRSYFLVIRIGTQCAVYHIENPSLAALIWRVSSCLVGTSYYLICLTSWWKLIFSDTNFCEVIIVL